MAINDGSSWVFGVGIATEDSYTLCYMGARINPQKWRPPWQVDVGLLHTLRSANPAAAELLLLTCLFILLLSLDCTNYGRPM